MTEQILRVYDYLRAHRRLGGLLFVVLTAVLFVGATFVNDHLSQWAALAVNTLLILLFVAVLIKRDFPLSSLPVVGKYFRKR